MINKNEFFRQATLRICGDLEIEQAMSALLRYLSQVMPADRIFLQVFDRGLGAMRTITHATQTESRKEDLLTPLSSEVRATIERAHDAPARDVFIFEKPEENPISREMLHFHRVTATSLMVLTLISGTHILGSVVLITNGQESYNAEHARLFSLVKEPFVIAMSNTLKHRELAQLKDLLADDNRFLQSELRRMSGEEIVGANFGLKQVMEEVRKVAVLDTPVLLLGETGAGKEVIANTIHASSPRNNGPLITVNCGAIPESLIDSELFGHEKGAFTGALSQKRGRFERANRGTVFLDEIGELPLAAQVRLLRVLQEKEIERVGGTKAIGVDCRVIAATHRNLEEMVRDGQFR
ncbi:MAG: sigma-54 factor interaction domain-containing protein, partial [bacterium]|nr:sigma-54 factor interaction domain-containing protein [bacterium]